MSYNTFNAYTPTTKMDVLIYVHIQININIDMNITIICKEYKTVRWSTAQIISTLHTMQIHCPSIHSMLIY